MPTMIKKDDKAMEPPNEKPHRKIERDDVPESSNHIPPPESGVLKGGKVNSKTRALKAVTSIIADADENPQKKVNNETNGVQKQKTEDLSKRIGKFEYLFYKFLLVLLYICFGSFRYGQYQYHKMKLRIFSIIYNHAYTPQLIRQDVIPLKKIPKRLAAILEVKPVGDVGGGVTGLLNDASEIVCWTVSAGIKHLTLYDYDGILQRNVPELRMEIHSNLAKYFGPAHVPNYAVKIPHSNKIFYNLDGIETETDVGNEIEANQEKDKIAIEISLLSNRDGRETIVDLTKTMAELCAVNELSVSDITMDLVDSELKQLVGPEPDLLLYFGPSLDLQGFPPWHIRLTEFYWEKDNNEVIYSVFIRGLRQYAGCKVNVGK
ncbi:CFC_HP_G0082920.mRNA.1.CDS.1 [Saccharomyces cerevisiae]|nr:CFC_HP_G0036790.mRNA.1.CDS.1 [Saccharomyces cerevisiae]CAI4977327.1 CFC_HP_G0082920.mRNA.1.CDS.1 [Saccharomyces cerevisiae]CAI6395134.1 CFC_HP_G0036790.mRNA.1.CDS.1 [Saccharomyces cerevisiae]CAI6786131.1 CFC_HP_G0082920.mRNA.1.CDS.1 [Saccharomyces cerevisiae]CAI7177988.1 CFC_collapsed_G0006980.mRNA.1.CDS.1 [Saccharomyces cerevisiae]